MQLDNVNTLKHVVKPFKNIHNDQKSNESQQDSSFRKDLFVYFPTYLSKV